MDRTMKIGDFYPLITFDIGDMRGFVVTYDFVPDSKRAKRRGGRLRPQNIRQGMFYPPRPRTPGVAELTIHWPDGKTKATVLELIRWVREL